MSRASAARRFEVERATIEVYPTKEDLWRAAALSAASVMRKTISAKGLVRLIVATGNSQEGAVAGLVQAAGIDWSRAEVFHMDEYVGLPPSHDASFRKWLDTRITDRVHPGRIHYLDGNAPDPGEECRRYERLLRSAPIDLCLLGIGENGHIAFNDPHMADFADALGVKRVTLDERCRGQQVAEGHFLTVGDVPPEALTLTCPMLMSAENIVCSVPGPRKAEAVRNALEGPVATACPASILRTHPRATIFLDLDSASLLRSATP